MSCIHDLEKYEHKRIKGNNFDIVTHFVWCIHCEHSKHEMSREHHVESNNGGYYRESTNK